MLQCGVFPVGSFLVLHWVLMVRGFRAVLANICSHFEVNWGGGHWSGGIIPFLLERAWSVGLVVVVGWLIVYLIVGGVVLGLPRQLWKMVGARCRSLVLTGAPRIRPLPCSSRALVGLKSDLACLTEGLPTLVDARGGRARVVDVCRRRLVASKHNITSGGSEVGGRKRQLAGLAGGRGCRALSKGGRGGGSRGGRSGRG